jgi:hypothetical protein
MLQHQLQNKNVSLRHALLCFASTLSLQFRETLQISEVITVPPVTLTGVLPNILVDVFAYWVMYPELTMKPV